MTLTDTHQTQLTEHLQALALLKQTVLEYDFESDWDAETNWRYMCDLIESDISGIKAWWAKYGVVAHGWPPSETPFMPQEITDAIHSVRTELYKD